MYYLTSTLQRYNIQFEFSKSFNIFKDFLTISHNRQNESGSSSPVFIWYFLSDARQPRLDVRLTAIHFLFHQVTQFLNVFIFQWTAKEVETEKYTKQCKQNPEENVTAKSDVKQN